MESVMIYNILVGSLLITLGIVFIFFHEELKKIDMERVKIIQMLNELAGFS